MNKVQILILAAGKGSRMKSDLPKPMHKISGKTMLEIVLSHANNISDDITIVYSDAMKPYLDSLFLPSQYKCVRQSEPLGTGHAVYSAIGSIDFSFPTIVLYADNPFIDDSMIRFMWDSFVQTESDIMVMAFERDNPDGYGRVVLDDNGFVSKIIECKIANAAEKSINLCNSGIILFNSNVLKESLIDLIANYQTDGGEYYLTHLLEIAYKKGYKTNYFRSSGAVPLGVNTQEELQMAREMAEGSEMTKQPRKS